MQINMKPRYLNDYLIEKIVEKTNFDSKKIELMLSKRKNQNSKELDYHEFLYCGKKYILDGDCLIEE